MSPLASTVIADHTVRQVQTFLYNLANRTRQHAQIDSVTQQVTRQYQGRTAIELLQNAHDALRRGASSGRGRILFTLVDEGDHGALYVANDGRPVQDREATALAEIGLSSKDPATDVGNKGLGFRSVLDVTERPAVYSCAAEGEGVLGGHCLLFTPTVVDDVAQATAHALAGRPAAFLNNKDLLADWSETLRAGLRQRGRDEGNGWPASELCRLSPYALPVPASPTPLAKQIAADGYSTVVHLPLRSADARANVCRELAELRESDDLGLFLDALRVLSIDTGEGAPPWTLDRSESRPPEVTLRHRTVTLTRSQSGVESGRSFSVWSRTVGDTPEERDALQTAAAELPDDWSRIDRVTVDVATEHVEAPPVGRYSIFLPTVQPTGTGAFVNAPFYGSLDRRAVDFAHDYNELLRQEAVRLSAAAMLDLMGGSGADAWGVTDLLAPVGTPTASMAPDVRAAVEGQAGTPLTHVPLIQTSGGWVAPHNVRVADLCAERCPLGPASLAELASFAQPSDALAPRSHRIRDLLTACGLPPAPSTDERADLAEAVAAAIPPDGDWDSFWEWARELCGGTIAPLRTRRVLLVSGDRRLALDGQTKVFFPPQVGAAAAVPVPSALSGHVAFLDIPLRQQDVQNAPATRAKKALAEFESDLAYDAPGLVKRVLVPALPDLPVPLDSPKGHLCSAVLRWAVQLYAERTVGSELNELPVPCRGGWHPATKAMFGPGWGGLGDDLDAYLSETGTPTAQKALLHLVVPPDHPVWDGDAADLRDSLHLIGVADGLRLQPSDVTVRLRLHDGTARVEGGGHLPRWAEVRAALKTHSSASRTHKSAFSYETEQLWTLPGLKAFGDLSPPGRQALSRLVLGSVDSWERDAQTRRYGSGEPSTWRTTFFSRRDRVSDRFPVPSPLAVALQTLPWITNGDYHAPPSGWWVLPPDWADGQARSRYAYLHPIPHAPQSVAGRRALRELGAHLFLPDPERPPSAADAARFIEAVATAADHKTAAPSDLRSHARKGWEALPDDSETWPARLLVGVGDTVRAWTPAEASPCDLPPSLASQADALRAAGHPLVVIDSKDASRLADAIVRAYDGGVRSADTLRSVVLADDQAWEGGGQPLPDSALGWAIDVVLAAHAFSGTQTYGTSTPAFARAHAALRSASVAHVERLATQIDLGQARTEPRPTDAWWDEPTQTLLLRRGAPARAVARPFTHLVSRRDLLYPLESAFSTLDVGGTGTRSIPSAEQLQRVDEALGVNDDRRRDVAYATREDAAWLRERVLPVLVLGGADPETVEIPLHEHGFRTLLAQFGPPAIPPETILDACRTSRSDADLGRYLYDAASIPLSTWNEALERIARPPVANENGPAEAARALDALRPFLRSALRHDAIVHGEPARYHAAAAALAAATVDAETARSTWRAPTLLAASSAAFALRELSPEVASLAVSAPSPDALRAWLVEHGANPADPEALLQENRRTGRSAADALQRIWIAARLSLQNPPPPSPLLDQALDSAVTYDGLTEPWTPLAARRAVAQHAARHHQGDPDPVLQAASSEFDAADLLLALDLTPAQVDEAQATLDAQRDASRRQQRTLPIAGSTFYADDLNELWVHLQSHVSDESLVADPASLEPMLPSRPAPNTGPGGKRATVPRRAPQWRRDLVGLAGEILAYRALRQQYGDAVVTPTSWKSGNQSLAHGRRPGDPDPSANDSLGYDIEFVVDGVTYQIEVKASEGDRQAFEMGESETRAARAAVDDESVRYQILRVSDALSATPHIAILPNPFLPSSSGLFDIRTQGAVVYFHLSKA